MIGLLVLVVLPYINCVDISINALFHGQKCEDLGGSISGTGDAETFENMLYLQCNLNGTGQKNNFKYCTANSGGVFLYQDGSPCDCDRGCRVPRALIEPRYLNGQHCKDLGGRIETGPSNYQGYEFWTRCIGIPKPPPNACVEPSPSNRIFAWDDDARKAGCNCGGGCPKRPTISPDEAFLVYPMDTLPPNTQKLIQSQGQVVKTVGKDINGRVLLTNNKGTLELVAMASISMSAGVFCLVFLDVCFPMLGLSTEDAVYTGETVLTAMTAGNVNAIVPGGGAGVKPAIAMKPATSGIATVLQEGGEIVVVN